ncbi:MAG: hypothetical protein JWR18_2108 [Segetibacter sp.]|nr:hypothetical protein [Segetibacter sp.]
MLTFPQFVYLLIVPTEAIHHEKDGQDADLLDGIRVDEVMLEEYLRDSVDGENIIVARVYLKKKQEQLHVGMLTKNILHFFYCKY